LNLIDDCERFVLEFFDVIEQSAMHIYHSALPWSPTSSPTRKLYEDQLTTEVKLVNAINARWDPWIKTIPIHNSFTTIAFSHLGSALAVVSKDDVKIFETATGMATFKVEKSAVSIAFSTRDDMFVCGFEDGTVMVWDVQTSNVIQTFKGHANRVFSVAFSPCSNMIVSAGEDKTVRKWNMSSGHCECVFEGHSNWVSAVCMSATGDRVISGSWDASVMVWDVSKAASPSLILRGHTEGVTSVASSSDSSSIASGSLDGTINIYDAQSGDVRHTISTNGDIFSIQFSIQDHKLLYTNRHSAMIWDLSQNTQLLTIDCDGCRSAFSPDATRIASGSERHVKIWNTEDGDQDSEAVNHNPTKAIAFSPDGRFIASRSLSDVKIWDTTSGNCLFALDSHRFLETVVFSPDSAFVACWPSDSHPEVQVWNVRTRSQVKVVRAFERFSSNVALSPCGGRLVSLSSSHITLFDLESGKHLASLDFDSQFWRTWQIAFAVDGTSIFIHKGEDIKQRWRISDTRSPNYHDDHSSNTNQSTSLPLVFTPMQEASSHEVISVPRKCCRYEGDEWIVDENGKRILWLPSDRRGVAIALGKRIAVGTNHSDKVYLASFPDHDALLLP
jgi:WD40 repeat protein